MARVLAGEQPARDAREGLFLPQRRPWKNEGEGRRGWAGGACGGEGGGGFVEGLGTVGDVDCGAGGGGFRAGKTVEVEDFDVGAFDIGHWFCGCGGGC